jgi:hypothetical protein
LSRRRTSTWPIASPQHAAEFDLPVGDWVFVWNFLARTRLQPGALQYDFNVVVSFRNAEEEQGFRHSNPILPTNVIPNPPVYEFRRAHSTYWFDPPLVDTYDFHH